MLLVPTLKSMVGSPGPLWGVWRTVTAESRSKVGACPPMCFCFAGPRSRKGGRCTRHWEQKLLPFHRETVGNGWIWLVVLIIFYGFKTCWNLQQVEWTLDLLKKMLLILPLVFSKQLVVYTTQERIVGKLLVVTLDRPLSFFVGISPFCNCRDY